MRESQNLELLINLESAMSTPKKNAKTVLLSFTAAEDAQQMLTIRMVP